MTIGMSGHDAQYTKTACYKVDTVNNSKWIFNLPKRSSQHLYMVYDLSYEVADLTGRRKNQIDCTAVQTIFMGIYKYPID